MAHPGSNSFKHLVEKWAEAYNSHNADAIAELYHDDAVNTQIPYPSPVQGREGIRAVYKKTFQAFPDIRLEVEKLLENGDGAAIEWVFKGTMSGDFAGHPPTGRGFNMRGCEAFQFREGKIISQHGYWDKQTMFSQLGI